MHTIEYDETDEEEPEEEKKNTFLVTVKEKVIEGLKKDPVVKLFKPKEKEQ